MAGAGDAQVGGASRRERRWGAGANERGIQRCTDMGGGDGRKEESKERSRQTVETGGAGGLV